MPTELLLKIAISGSIGLIIGAVDLAGLFVTIRFFSKGKQNKNFFVAFIISEMVRLALVMGILFSLFFVKYLLFGWVVAGPLVFSIFKFIYAFGKIKQL